MNDASNRQQPPATASSGHVTTPAPGAVFNPYRLFRGAHVPMAVLGCSDLSPGAKLCYGLMKDMAGRQGYCWPALRSLARKLGVSREQAKRYVRELVAYRLIAPEATAGAVNRYVFLWHGVFAIDSPVGGGISDPTPRVKNAPGGRVISATRTPKYELPQLNSRSSSSPVHFPEVVGTGNHARAKKKQIKATTTPTQGDSPPQASEYSDPREYLRALFLASTGTAIDAKLDRFIRETLELRGCDLAMFLEDIRPRLMRLRRRAGPGFWYRHALEFGASWTRPLPPEPPPPPAPPQPEKPKCGTCGYSLGHGFIMRDGQPDYCAECETWRAAHPRTTKADTVAT